MCPLTGTLWFSVTLISLSPLRLQTAPPDVDECETGVCAEECLNTPGSFRCFCDGRRGMKLSQDLRSCKVKYTNSKTVLKFGADGGLVLDAASFIISNFLSASNSLHVAASEEELSFSLPRPHVQRRADGEAALSPESSDRVRTTCLCGSPAEAGDAPNFGSFLPPPPPSPPSPPSQQLFSRV